MGSDRQDSGCIQLGVWQLCDTFFPTMMLTGLTTTSCLLVLFHTDRNELKESMSGKKYIIINILSCNACTVTVYYMSCMT